MAVIKLTGELKADDSEGGLSTFDRFSLGFAGAFGKGCAWITTIVLGICVLRLMGFVIPQP